MAHIIACGCVFKHKKYVLLFNLRCLTIKLWFEYINYICIFRNNFHSNEAWMKC